MKALAVMCLATGAVAIHAGATAVPFQRGFAQMTSPDYEALMQQPADIDHPYVGMWITRDGHIRHNLLPDGRYDEARGTRESAYQGRYELRGNLIHYWDDTGFTADGEFIDDVLHHAGMILYRNGNAKRWPLARFGRYRLVAHDGCFRAARNFPPERLQRGAVTLPLLC